MRALVDEALKKVALSEELRRFTDEELCEAACLDEFDWRGVKTWWDKRREGLQDWLGNDWRDGVLLDLERIPGGGRGVRATTAIVVRQLANATTDQPLRDEDSNGTGPIHFRQSASNPIRLSGPWRRRLFSAGEIKVGSGRHALLRWRILTSAIFLLMIAGALFLDLVLRNRPVETQNIAYLFGFLIIAKLWWAEWRPIYYARVDRITALPEDWLQDDEPPAQLERKRTESGEVLRLVRHQAICPLCGADVHLGEGTPSDPRRVLGRCIDAPREHVFTFDPVSHKGHYVGNRDPGIP